MKLSLNWLKDYVDPKLSTDELVQRLTMAGLEVEEVHSVGKDTVLDLEITPNRPDCLNTVGLAREISAITAKDLKLPKVKVYKPTKVKVPVTIEDKKDCARYIGTVIKDVQIAASPAHISECINSIGTKAINNAVDITNFVLMEFGQPLHVFDLDKLAGGRIVVRRARAGEKLVTLDGIERKLDPSILVIADAEKPVAIAGIMGGLATSVTASTKNVLLESAHFDLGIVRRGSRTLGLKSDSSYRFERGVDMGGVLTGADRATDLLLELTRGKFVGRNDVGAALKASKKTIAVSLSGIEALLGTKVSAAQVKGGLKRLGLGVAAGRAGAFKVTVPGFRGDLKQPVDIIEEVARIIGYDNLDMSFPTIQVKNITPDPRPRRIKKIAQRVMLANGFSETINYSLVSQKDLDKSDLGNVPALKLYNALSSEFCILRPSVMPSMFRTAALNFNRGQRELKIFEIGKRYTVKDGEKPVLAFLMTGRRREDWRGSSKDANDFNDLKGIVEDFLGAVGAAVSYEPGSFYEAIEQGAGANIKLNGNVFGTMGRVTPKVLAQWDIKAKDVYFAGICLDALRSVEPKVRKYEAVPEFPGVNRDISIAVKSDLPWARIKDICVRLGGTMLVGVHLIEEYTGEKIQGGHRGLVFSLTYRSSERTLREEEVNAVHQNILKELTQETGAQLR